MSRPRTTYPVWRLLEDANRKLDKKQCPKLTPEKRESIASWISVILHDTNNYEGFSYNEFHYAGAAACLKYDDCGAQSSTPSMHLGDQTARCYQMSGALRACKERDDGNRL